MVKNTINLLGNSRETDISFDITLTRSVVKGQNERSVYMPQWNATSAGNYKEKCKAMMVQFAIECD